MILNVNENDDGNVNASANANVSENASSSSSFYGLLRFQPFLLVLIRLKPLLNVDPNLQFYLEMSIK